MNGKRVVLGGLDKNVDVRTVRYTARLHGFGHLSFASSTLLSVISVICHPLPPLTLTLCALPSPLSHPHSLTLSPLPPPIALSLSLPLRP
jgi:hypothetical protein